MMTRPAESGMALLEAVVALAILGGAGLALAQQVREAAHATRSAAAAENRVAEASAFLQAVALWSMDDLDRHLGDRQNGPWRLEVQRPEPSLYEVVVRDSSGAAILVATTLHRRAPGA